MYENLVNNTFEDTLERNYYPKDIDDKELHYKRLLEHCKDHLNWWKPEFGDYTAIDTDKSKDNLADSWLYEHTIFDLVRIYTETIQAPFHLSVLLPKCQNKEHTTVSPHNRPTGFV